jgi:hypothetical protein
MVDGTLMLDARDMAQLGVARWIGRFCLYIHKTRNDNFEL